LVEDNRFTPQDVERGRALVGQESDAKWALGDLAIELFGWPPGAGPGRGKESLAGAFSEYAEAIGLSDRQLRERQRVAAYWPERSRRADVSWTVHRELQQRLPDDADKARARKLLRQRKSWTLRSLIEALGGAPIDRRVSDAPTPEQVAEAVTHDDAVAEAADRALNARAMAAHREQENERRAAMTDRERDEQEGRTAERIRKLSVDSWSDVAGIIGDGRRKLMEAARAIADLREHGGWTGLAQEGFADEGVDRCKRAASDAVVTAALLVDLLAGEPRDLDEAFARMLEGEE
jgi:hypothetical protein